MHMLHMSMTKANSALAAQIWANSHLKNLGSLVEPQGEAEHKFKGKSKCCICHKLINPLPEGDTE